jgi:uncharacterized protein (DUF4213/DUF364 family)
VIMKIIDDLLTSLDLKTDVRDIRQGVFHTGVWSRNCGLAATLARDAFRQTPPMVKEPGFLLEENISELVRLAYSESILEAAIGMAAINSLIDVEEGKCLEMNAKALIAEKGENRKIAVVGHFPFIPSLRKIAGELWVIDKNPREGDFSETEAEKLIPQADVVAITGTAFTNHTLDDLLELCPSGAYVLMLGDTAPLSPVLFDYGVDAVCGTRVVAPVLALRCVSEGANFRQIKGVKRLTMKK